MSDWFVQTGTGGGAQHEYVWTQTSGVVSYLVFMVSELSNKCLYYADGSLMCCRRCVYLSYCQPGPST